VNRHSETLRHLFVAHKGQKKLTVHMEGAADFDGIALRLTEKIEENVCSFKSPAPISF
jgi:hypothetical protein